MMKSMMKRSSVALTLLAFAAIPANAQVFTATLNGNQESPAVSTSGIGAGTASFDPLTNLLSVSVTFSGLSGNTTDSHIHCCFTDPPSRNVGVALGFTPAGFPIGVTSGTFNATYNLLDPNVYTSAFRTNFGGGTAAGARDALLAGMTNGTAYFNVHSTFRTSGEIRGDITPVPEPSTIALLGIGGLAIAIATRRRLRSKAR